MTNKAIYTKKLTDPGEALGGNLPEPEGEQTTCSGMKACAASHKKGQRVKCEINAWVGVVKGEVLATATGKCSGATLPAKARSEVCLFEYGTGGFAPIEFGQCKPNVGNNPTYRYALQKAPCAKYTSYTVWGWFWMPGLKSGKVSTPEREVQCATGPGIWQHAEEPIYFTIELLEGAGQYLESD
jgi:hypothetical protein